jgi:hypothetical protein
MLRAAFTALILSTVLCSTAIAGVSEEQPAATTPPAPVKPPAAKDAAAGAPTNAALTSLVAEAIKRKLDRVASAKTPGGIELPPSRDASPDTAQPMITPAPGGMPMTGPMTLPDLTMMAGGAKMMMGAPADGSPAYVRVAADSKNPAPAPAAAPSTAGGQFPPANPLARPTDPMEAGTEPAAAASEPGTCHNLLDIFVGTWDVTANFDTGPGQPPETASGQMSNSWQLDGRWLKQEYSGQMSSLGAFRGLGYLGYDNLQKTYVGTWMDTLSTSCIVSKGAYDQSTSTFTLTGDFTVPGGERFKQKQVMTVLSPDRYVVTMFLAGPDGVEFKTGNLEYTRALKKVTTVSPK